MEPLPEGWAWAALGEVLREPLRNGHSAKATSSGDGVRTLTLTAVTVGDFSEANTKVTSASQAQADGLWLEPGDLFVERANTPELVGTARLYRGPKRKCIFPDLLVRVRVSNEIDARFVEAMLHAEPTRRYFRRAAQGIAGSMPKISQGTIAGAVIPLPPLAEQRRIVDALEAQFTRLDAAVATLERVRANLTRCRASTLLAGVDGRMLRDPRRDDTLPRGWKRTTVGALTTAITSGSRDWSPYYGRGTSTFIMAQNVRPGVLDLSFRQAVDPPAGDASRDRSQVRRGDLLVTIVGANTGDLCRVPRELPDHFVCQSVALMRPSSEVLPEFLEFYLNSPRGRRQYDRFIYGAGRPHLSFEQLRATEVTLPPPAAQQEIVARLGPQLSALDALSSAVTAQAARMAAVRQSLFRLAFSGRLVPQDPADEPASVLLDRIRRERAAAAPSERKPSRSRT